MLVNKNRYIPSPNPTAILCSWIMIILAFTITGIYFVVLPFCYTDLWIGILVSVHVHKGHSKRGDYWYITEQFVKVINDTTIYSITRYPIYDHKSYANNFRNNVILYTTRDIYYNSNIANLGIWDKAVANNWINEGIVFLSIGFLIFIIFIWFYGYNCFSYSKVANIEMIPNISRSNNKHVKIPDLYSNYPPSDRIIVINDGSLIQDKV